MEGQLTSILQALLTPASWLADMIGLPNRLPAVELGVGLVFMTACFGLALVALYHWIREHTLIRLLASIILILGGVTGVFLSIALPSAWIILLLLAIITADVFWRMVSNPDLPRPLRKAATMWAAVALFLSAGTPTTFLLHSWIHERQANADLIRFLESERAQIDTQEVGRLSEAVATLATAPELTEQDLVVGNGSLIVTLQRMAVEQRLSYLVLLNSGGTVVARTQPSTLSGDRWPVSLLPTPIADTSGVTKNERGLPILLVAKVFSGTHANQYVLVAGTPLDQTYAGLRQQERKQPLFITTGHGVVAASAADGATLNAVTTASVDSKLASTAEKAVSFRVAEQGVRYIVRTLPVHNAAGTYVFSLGSTQTAGNPVDRLRLDLIVVVGFAVFLLAVPSLVWRKRKEGA